MISKQKFVSNFHQKESSVCKVCTKESEKVYQLYQKYFTILALPLFPTRKIVYWCCTSCSVIKEVRSGNNNTLDNREQDISEELKATNKSQFNLRYYWGSILIFIAAILIILGISSL
jgi:hypothetical protein